MNKRGAFASLVVTLAFVAVGVAQSKSLHLGVDFSAAALEAVRVIDSYGGMTGARSDASEAVILAGSAARSQGEQDATRTLHGFLDDKLDNNLMRAQLSSIAVNAWKNTHLNTTDEELLEVRAQALDVAGVREMTRREDDCAASMSRMLRGGIYRAPERCEDVRISRDEHAMQQYFKQAKMVTGNTGDLD